jgi:hypothetical protein
MPDEKHASELPEETGKAVTASIAIRRAGEYPVFHRLAFMAIMVFAFLCFPLWPVFMYMQTKDREFLRHYFRSIARGFTAIFLQIKYGSFFRAIKNNLFKGPAYIQEQRARLRGACLRCARCCKALECPGVGFDEETGLHYCKSYDSLYWHYGPCGQFPIDQADVDAHNCKGFYFASDFKQVSKKK